MQRFLFISILLLSVGTLFSQEGTPFELKGRVVDSETGDPITFASIVITTRKKGLASNHIGEFEFEAQVGDVVKITSIGYNDYHLILTEDFAKEENRITFFMDSKAYVLDSVVVFHMTDNFYLKKKKWDTLQVENPYLNTVNPTDWSKTQFIPNTDGTAGVSIAGLLNVFDKKHKQQQRLKKLEEASEFEKKRKAKIDAKFNKKLVKRVTRIDDRVIDEFMDFCNFRDAEILYASEYELTMKILDRYKAFLIR
ncbi:carboxypeptidase-like regulatory domain-containing protein [Roseivirga pacifica]